MNPTQQEYQTERAINTRNRIPFMESEQGVYLLMIGVIVFGALVTVLPGWVL